MVLNVNVLENWKWDNKKRKKDTRELFDILSKVKIWDVSVKKIWDQYEQSRFTRPAYNNVKDVTKIENYIIDLIPDDFDHIRLSELAPLWIYNLLFAMSPKRSMVVDRWYEICSDLSVGLALEWLAKRKKQKTGPIKISGFDTTIRPQNFYWATWDKNKWSQYGRSVIHFNVYWNAIVDNSKNEQNFVNNNLGGLLSHYLDIINKLNGNNYWLNNIKIVLSDMNHTKDILSKSHSSLHKFRDYQLKERCNNGIEPGLWSFIWMDIKQDHETIESLEQEVADKDLDIDVWYLKEVSSNLQNIKKKYSVDITYKLWRSWWAGQYSSIAFSIFAETPNGQVFDIADWWVTDWWEKLLSKTERCLVWGLWTSLLAEQYKKDYILS